MSRARTSVVVVGALACGILLAGCGGDEEAGEPARAVVAGATSLKPTTTAAPLGAWVEGTLSTGGGISTEPTTCSLDGGAGNVAAGEGDFTLAFADGVGAVHWAYDGGTIDESDVPVEVDGSTLRISGVTSAGVGYDAAIHCG